MAQPPNKLQHFVAMPRWPNRGGRLDPVGRWFRSVLLSTDISRMRTVFAKSWTRVTIDVSKSHDAIFKRHSSMFAEMLNLRPFSMANKRERR
jgi:hypothetical protein